jgi:hypothetical protein
MPAPPSTPPSPSTPPLSSTPPQARPIAAAEANGGEMAAALAAAVERLRARVEEQAGAQVATAQRPVTKPPPHKHTMSLIARTRLALRRRREQRKQRRAA